MLTTEETVALAVVAFGALLGLSVGYRPTGWEPLLAFLTELLIIVMAILFAAGVQFRALETQWRPRMLLVLLGIVVLPLSGRAGAKGADHDFKYRRQKNYEALIAAIKSSPGVQTRDWFEVLVPAEFTVDARVWARRQSEDHLHVEFIWSRHEMYVFCEEPECVPDEHWRANRRLDAHWVLAFH